MEARVPMVRGASNPEYWAVENCGVAFGCHEPTKIRDLFAVGCGD